MNIKSRSLTTGILVLISSFMLAQKVDISGLVVDENQEALISATVVVLSPKDSTMLSFSLTGNKGQFIIRDIKENIVLLQVSYLGFQQYSQTLNVDLAAKSMDLGSIQLSPNINQMEEILIEGEHTPIMVKKDTIEYNAAAFQTQPNEVVEDLLRRLPGVEVEADGSIKAQGEDVNQVLVDGKEFFGKDPKIATRNLPADAVNKVQIYDDKSDMAEFSGVDDGEREKTINLQLKEDRRKGSFGTVSAGYGTEDRYSGKLSLNRFDKKMKLSALGNFNNINEQGFSVSDYVSFMGGLGSFMGGGGGRFGGDIPISNGLSNGFVTTKSGGLNFNYDFSAKTEMSLSYFINSIGNTIDQRSSQDNFLEEGSYITTQNSLQLSESDNHRINFRLEHEIDSTQDVRLQSSVSYNQGTLNSNSLSQIFDAASVLENTTDRIYDSEGENLDFSGSALYRKKLGKKKRETLTFEGALNNANNDFNADNDSENIFFPEDPQMTITELILQEQQQTDDQTDYRVEASYVRPISASRFLEFNYTRQNYNTELIRNVYDVVNGDRFENLDLSTQYIRNYSYDRFGGSLHFNSEKTQLSLEAAIQNSHLNGDIISEGQLIETDILRFLPRASMRHELGNSHDIRMRYSTSVREPSLTQLQPITDNSDPQNIYIGNPDLIPEYRHNLRINYTNYDQFSFRSIFGYINASYTKNKITEQTYKEEGRQVRKSVNVDYDFNLNTTVSFSTPIRPLKIKTDLRTRLGYQRSQLFINAVENSLDRYTGNIRLSIENRKKETLDWIVGGSWSYNINQYSESDDADQSYYDQNLFADFTYNLKNKFAFDTGIDINFYSEQSFSEAEVIPVWMASLSAYVLKDQRGEIKLSVFDLLNKNKGISRSSNLNFIQNTEIVSLGRYFMLSMIYSIKSSGSQTGGKPKFRMEHR